MGLHLDRLADIVTAVPETQGEQVQGIKVEGAIKVREVSFRYGAADQFVLEKIDLDIEAGNFVAITGPSGGGKTTLLKLLLGLHRPTSGAIEIDGRRADPDLWRAWRTQVGVVAQDDRLLSGTIADNIAFFDPDLDMQKVQAAAMAAQVHDDIMRSPMQYLGLVGDMGSTLSGGQRQRVLLARALYNQPRVLFLDEGTANLDEATEEAIADLIEQLPITRIVVAHRPALIRRAKQVFIVKDRQIIEACAVEQGPRLVLDEAKPIAAGLHAAARAKLVPFPHAPRDPVETQVASAPQQASEGAPETVESTKSDEVAKLAPVIPPRRRWARRAGALAAAFALAIGGTLLWQRVPLPSREVLDVSSQAERQEAPPAPPRVFQPQQSTAPSIPDVPAATAPLKQDEEPIEQLSSRDSTRNTPAPRPAAGPVVAALVSRAARQAPSASRAPFRDCADCPEMVPLSGGTFSMGSQDDPSERPIHPVTVRPFALGRFPIMIGEWRRCSAAQACTYQPNGDDAEPVRNVSWTDAQQYIAWMSKVTDQSYRLPTEAEWEYAARAGAATKYWWGNQVVAGVANCKQCGEPYDPQRPAKIDSFRPNPFGLYGMAGGVAQWVSDCWHKDYRGAPEEGSSWNAPNCSERVLRGGSWKNNPSYLRTANRNRYDAVVRYPTHGFRVARTVVEGTP
jgi:formylglycine-generating enzyme required for sulfatase activity/ABC-type lipoprotein export system ATPase subunit